MASEASTSEEPQATTFLNFSFFRVDPKWRWLSDMIAGAPTEPDPPEQGPLELPELDAPELPPVEPRPPEVKPAGHTSPEPAPVEAQTADPARQRLSMPPVG